jgi:hypothetical protein
MGINTIWKKIKCPEELLEDTLDIAHKEETSPATKIL